ncbi:MAG TPA: hypothetical protein VFU02_19650 [Polyangiaceae bacterium]|nr:hypothetical protein [Polyangiaceae bacterium]
MNALTRNALLALLLGGASVPGACYSGGLVGADCRSGLSECAGECVDLATDGQNCGACGVVCPAGRACFQGLYCEGFEVGTGGNGGAAGSPSSSSGGSAGAGIDAGGAPSECIEPFNTAEHCGACEAACAEGRPRCACTDGACECVSECESPLSECGSACADLENDASHCGSCFLECPSGVCQNGTCAGALPGHVVLMCSSFEQARENHPQTMLLGNAVFLPAENRVRILSYNEHADPTAESRVAQALGWAAAARGRDFVMTEVGLQGEVPTLLTPQDYEVFLVLDQPNAPPGELATAGAAWQSTLGEFVEGGGTVIVLGGPGGVAEMATLVSNAGLLELETEEALAATASLYVRAPTDSVGTNALSPFQPLGPACTFSPSEPPDQATVYVVTNAPPGGELGNPMVIHRVPGF